MEKCHFVVVNTRQVLREGVCGRFDLDGYRRDTHPRAVSTADRHTVLTLIKTEETCRLEELVCVGGVCDGDFAGEAERCILSLICPKGLLSALMTFVHPSVHIFVHVWMFAQAEP